MSDDPGKLEEIAIRLRDKILAELSAMETSKLLEEGSTEQRLKAYTGFFKLVQSLEEITKRIQQERDKKSDRGVDILEFRRQLEEQIAELVDKKNQAVVS